MLGSGSSAAYGACWRDYFALCLCLLGGSHQGLDQTDNGIFGGHSVNPQAQLERGTSSDGPNGHDYCPGCESLSPLGTNLCDKVPDRATRSKSKYVNPMLK